jgi:hypothetical protein
LNSNALSRFFGLGQKGDEKMYRKISTAIFTSGVFVLLFGVSCFGQTGTKIELSHFEYKGAFRMPKGNLGGDSTRGNSLSYGGSALTYNPLRNSLFIVGHPHERMVVEISIPEIVQSTNINNLKTAGVLQAPSNITNGNWDNLKMDGGAVGNGARPGGFLVHNNKLIGSSWAYYDGGKEAARSHFVASPDWRSTGTQFRGMYRVGQHPVTSGAVNGGFVGGYMAPVPEEWQPALGGPALTGMAALAIVSRTSLGPCAWVFDPNDVGEKDPAPATMLVGYPIQYPTLGAYGDSASLYYNRATEVRGIVFPEGGSSVLFFGRHGLGKTGKGDSCYGSGTKDPALHGTEVPGTNGVKYCYDPTDATKGVHAYPYVYRIWAYDAHQFVKVKNGTVNPSTGQSYQPWDVIPYAIWDITFPFAVEDAHILGVAYDPSTQRIFISQQSGERYGVEPFPLIQVFQLEFSGSGVGSGTSGGSKATPPSQPSRPQRPNLNEERRKYVPPTTPVTPSRTDDRTRSYSR